MTTDRLLLDTCACLWMSTAAPMRPSAIEAIDELRMIGRVFVSAITGWEVAQLARTARFDTGGPSLRWFEDLLSRSDYRLAPLNADILVASVELPGEAPRDPADRIVIATARALGAAVVTRDRRIIGYGEAGHVATLMC